MIHYLSVNGFPDKVDFDTFFKEVFFINGGNVLKLIN